jgi:hypothetical protein
MAEVQELRAVQHGQDRGSLAPNIHEILRVPVQGGHQPLLCLGQEHVDHA